ncbi:hypothetical protein P3T36_001452 [Kitasatospora sp. MAP12-15]|uniref:hypothetical protein n=1 Tax=unclassified Kitasatospora TaxID=2633591 RepID=UPI002473AF00|nr:hypothetical protein [Kitasatospora sp. MAP12-44]MDH6112570.1 hypothetical protein [Kitasatospora sp. MAP12-44]
MTETASLALAPVETPDKPFTPHEARADLRRLGRLLDEQARSGASGAELDVTLSSMRAVHERITGERMRR